VTGDAFRTGYEGTDAVSGITVTGGKVVRIDPPIHLLRSTMASGAEIYDNQWKLNVADVSGGADPDLYLNGELLNYAQNGGVLAGRPIEKTGAGTVRLGAANSYTGSVSIVEGAILLGTNGAFNADINLTLAGGEFDAGASTNAVGTLSVISNSTLAVSAGAELSFGNSSALDWGDNRLTITGAAAAHTLRFGTDANGLSAEQMKRIRWNGNRTKLDANGYLYPYVPGLVISVH
jgi:autotransporter-associated beta strand protein